MPHVKTVRFAQVVEKAGKPHQHITWTAPDKDPELAKAAKAHRLVTLHQNLRGPKKDYGTVGLHVGDHAQFLIFPKSVRAFDGRRVIAIDYDAYAGETVEIGDLRQHKPRKTSPAKKSVQRAAEEPPPETDSSPPNPPVEEPTPREEIEAAVSELKQKKYAAAIRRLELWLKRFPDA